MMGHWDQYLARQNPFMSSTHGLRLQLTQLEDTVFVKERAAFDIIDVADQSVKATCIRTEDDLKAALMDGRTGTRLISISSQRTISPLRVTSSLASILFQHYGVRPDFLRVLLSFGDEPHQSESSSGYIAFFDSNNGEYVLLYKLNFVEPSVQELSKARVSWSFRQLGVYHHHRGTSDLFILLHGNPASALPKMLADVREGAASRRWSDEVMEEFCSHPEMLHSSIISCYLDNWRPYLHELGEKFTRINDKVMVAKADDIGTDEFDSLVRSLRNTNDFTLFSSACCMSNLEVILSMSKSGKFSECQTSELHCMETTLRGYVESSKVLRDRILNATELAGYTLSLHNQLQIRNLTQETRTVAKDTGKVMLKLKDLTENSLDDSAIVRIITIISAIYLPGSFVGTVFGMNFFDFDKDLQQIAMAKDLWKFIALWLGLTLLTGGAYVYTMSRNDGPRKLSVRRVDDACMWAAHVV